MGDSGIVLTCFAWLITCIFFLQLGGYGNIDFELPHDPNPSKDCSTSGNVTCPTTQKTGTSFLRCVTGTALGAGLGAGVFLFFPPTTLPVIAAGLIAGAGIFFGCTHTGTLVREFLVGIVDVIVQSFGFMFQLLGLAVPFGFGAPWDGLLNAIIIYPPGIVLGFIGYKSIRGVGG